MGKKRRMISQGKTTPWKKAIRRINGKPREVWIRKFHGKEQIRIALTKKEQKQFLIKRHEKILPGKQKNPPMRKVDIYLHEEKPKFTTQIIITQEPDRKHDTVKEYDDIHLQRDYGAEFGFQKKADGTEETGLFFDENKVPNRNRRKKSTRTEQPR